MKSLLVKNLVLMMALFGLIAAGCNLLSSQSEATVTPSTPETVSPTGSVTVNAGTLTPLPLTPFTLVPGQSAGFPTSQLPPTIIAQLPTSTALPVNITIFSPIPGNVVASTVSVFGSALHPQFLQYQVEYGPDPNPNNLWYPASGVVLAPVVNGVLANWNTTITPDGIYQLRLRVFLRDGTSLYTVVNNIRIQNQAPTPVPTATQASPRPVAAFIANPPVGRVPQSITFVNRTIGVISSIQWNFGDGTTSTEVNPIHTYNTPGLYTVTLNITGPGGTSNVSQQIVVQSATPPVAAFVTDKTTGSAPLAVQFTDQSTGAVTAYFWNFGDGTTSGERNPAHTFTTVGTYNVILTVTSAGGSSSTTRQITVQNPSVPPPTAAFIANATQVQIGVPIQFTSQSTGNISSYTWNFGDGILSSAQNPTHTYNFPGIYPVTLIVSGPGGQNAVQSQITVVLPPTLTPTLTWTPTITATNTLTSTPVPPTSTGVPLPTEAPTNTGVPPTATFTLTPTETPTITSTATPLPTDVPTSTEAPTLTSTFTETATETPLPTDVPTSTEVPTLTPTFTETATETPLPTFTPTETPSETPTELPTLTPTFTETATETPLPAAPIAAFAPDVTAGDAPLTVQFANQSTGDIASITWDFGDGGTSTDVNPTYIYQTPGTYTVTLTISGAGGSNTAQTTITVNQPAVAPTAAFTSDVIEGEAPLTVQFTDQSTGDIAAYAWDFGDGGTSTDANPSHTYEAAGTYTVTLTVSGSAGATSIQATISVTEPAALKPVGLAETRPILPDLGQIQSTLQAIYGTGVNTGKRASVFTIVGDESAVRSGYLTPFSAPGNYILDDSSGQLQSIIDWYTATSINGATSFNGNSVTVSAGWTVASLLDPANSDPNQCSPGETPFACQLRLTQPAVVIISIGYNDVLQLTDPAAFADSLGQVIGIAYDNGVIPILTTVAPNSQASADQERAINDAIIETADEYDAPLINMWRALTELPDGSVDAGGIPSVAPTGAGDLSGTSMTTYGINALNFYTLTTLNNLRSIIFPDAAPS